LISKDAQDITNANGVGCAAIPALETIYGHTVALGDGPKCFAGGNLVFGTGRCSGFGADCGTSR
jgi:hypothetical protein